MNRAMSDIKDRIKQIIDREGLSAAAFAERIGVAQATISHILGARNKYPSTEFLLKLRRRYPDIDMNWLLTGSGRQMGPDGTPPEEEEDNATPLAIRPTPEADSDGSQAPGGPGGESYPLFAETAVFPPTVRPASKKRREIASGRPLNTPKETIRQVVAREAGAPRKVVEIRIFFDDNTFETFRPEK